ncbi:MAG: GDSL-type esterase/lipase family protein [Porcipelethomonas sp.]
MSKRQRNRSYTYVKSSTRPVLRFRFKVVVIIFLLVTAAFFVVYMTGANFEGDEEGSFTATWLENKDEQASGSSAEEQAQQKSKESNSENSVAEKVVNPVPESEPMSQTYFGRCVFVGDSITVGLSDYQLVPMKNVIAEVGMNIEKINTETLQTAYGETTVHDALVQANPENIYIMLGSNGIAWLTIDEMLAEYSEFTDSVKKSLPDSKIYILSIPPVTAARETSDSPILNSDIDEYNLKLLDLANEKGFYYVDVNSALRDESGKFPEENAADDGMHFNKSTYNIMLDYILAHVVK